MDSIDNILKQISQDNFGVLTYPMVRKAGATNDQFRRFLWINGYEKVDRGIYLAADALPDGMHLLSLKYPKAVFSYASALYLQNMAEREPYPNSITFANGYHSSLLNSEFLDIHYVKKEHYSLGLVKLRSPNGSLVNGYDLERTICDIIKRKEKLEISIFLYAMEKFRALPNKHKKIRTVMQYAQILGIEKKVRMYMEMIM